MDCHHHYVCFAVSISNHEFENCYHHHQEGSMSSTSYIARMKNLGDELAAAGRPVSDPEMVDYVLAGLDRDYDPVVAPIVSPARPQG